VTFEMCQIFVPEFQNLQHFCDLDKLIDRGSEDTREDHVGGSICVNLDEMKIICMLYV